MTMPAKIRDGGVGLTRPHSRHHDGRTRSSCEAVPEVVVREARRLQAQRRSGPVWEHQEWGWVRWHVNQRTGSARPVQLEVLPPGLGRTARFVEGELRQPRPVVARVGGVRLPRPVPVYGGFGAAALVVALVLLLGAGWPGGWPLLVAGFIAVLLAGLDTPPVMKRFAGSRARVRAVPAGTAHARAVAQVARSFAALGADEAATVGVEHQQVMWVAAGSAAAAERLPGLLRGAAEAAHHAQWAHAEVEQAILGDSAGLGEIENRLAIHHAWRQMDARASAAAAAAVDRAKQTGEAW